MQEQSSLHPAKCRPHRIAKASHHDNEVRLEMACIFVANILIELRKQTNPTLSDLLSMFRSAAKRS